MLATQGYGFKGSITTQGYGDLGIAEILPDPASAERSWVDENKSDQDGLNTQLAKSTQESLSSQLPKSVDEDDWLSDPKNTEF